VTKNHSVEAMRDAFDACDGDGSGEVDAEELVAVMGAMGEVVTLETCTGIIQNMDQDGNGTLDFAEFVFMMTNGEIKVVFCLDATPVSQIFQLCASSEHDWEACRVVIVCVCKLAVYHLLVSLFFFSSLTCPNVFSSHYSCSCRSVLMASPSTKTQRPLTAPILAKGRSRLRNKRSTWKSTRSGRNRSCWRESSGWRGQALREKRTLSHTKTKR